MMRWVRMMMVGGWAVCGTGMAAEPPAGSLTGPEDLRLNHGRYGHAAVSLGESIYVIGGSTGRGISGSVERIDPVSGEVTLLSYSVLPRRYHTAVTHEDRIYVLGGISSSGLHLEVEQFNPVTGENEVITELPRSRVRPRAAVHEGKLYVMGGSIGRSAQAAVDIYDFEEGIWTRGADKPTATECGVVLVDDRIYAVGGYDWTAGSTAFEVYHIAEDRWEKLPSLPVRTSAHSVAAADGRIYSFGDYHQLNRAMVYEPEAGEWSMLQVLYQDARHHDAVLHDDEIWVIGGNVRGRGSYLSLLHRFPVSRLEAADRRALADADDLTPRRSSRTAPAPRRTPSMATELRSLIEELAEALEQVETLALRWERRDTHSLMGDLGSGRILLEWVYEKPDRFYLKHWLREVEGTAEGEEGRFRSARRARYYEGDISDLIKRLSLTPDLLALLAADPQAQLRGTASSQKWERLPDEEMDGRSYAVVRAQRGVPLLPARHKPARLYFDKQTGLLSHIEEESEDDAEPMPGGADAAAALLGTVKTTIRASDIVLNESLDAALWREVRMEEGDEQVETAPEVVGIRVHAPSVHASRPAADEIVDKAAPDFELKLLDDETFRLSDHKGKVVVIDFWATWCGPCVRALPHMRELAETFADEDLVMVGVSRDRAGQERQVKKMLEEHRIPYANGIDVDNIAREYGVRGIPNVVLIDRDGVVRSRKVGFSPASAKALEGEVREWLAKEQTTIAMDSGQDERE